MAARFEREAATDIQPAVVFGADTLAHEETMLLEPGNKVA